MRVRGIFSGDIGCYTLGNAKPLDAVDTCLCMGAGITMAQGLGVVDSAAKELAFVGDSTFFASGITALPMPYTTSTTSRCACSIIPLRL